jgi:peptide/nickel transport system substrate-binding protein
VPFTAWAESTPGTERRGGSLSSKDHPDNYLYLNYGCGGELNYNGYCNPEVDKLIDLQSIEAHQERRKQLVWEIERKLAEEPAWPIIFYDRRATCWHSYVKGPTIMVNSIANRARMEDVWLDK